MYKEIKSRRLALLVAIALTGGSLAGATNAYAAEVTGQNVTINASTPPTNNATDPYGNTGSAAGAINDPANGDDVSGNTLTLANYDYSGKNIFGGFTRGTGRAKDNIVHIRSGGTVDSAVGGGTYGGGDVVGNRVYLHAGGLVDGVVGGYVDGASGSAEDNHVVVESGTVKNFIYGGNIGIASTGHVTGNTVKIAGGVIDAPVYGGYNNGSGNVTRNEVTVTGGINGSVIGGDTHGNGNVTGNTVTITGGEIHSFVFGGDTHGSGNVTGNTVTITGGEIRDHVYGGFRNGDGDVTGNIVNIGDGAHDLAAGTRIDQSIYGGFNNGGSGTISGNTLNVKASASAQNIHNFDTINFHFTNTLSPKLTLSDTAGTTIKSLLDITVKGLPTAVTGTLIENTAGTITVSDGPSSVTKTGDTAETILSTDRTGKKIDYTRYIFKGARTAESSSFHETWGGRSVIGNTTTGNEITVASGTHNVVYGGWTSGSGSKAAAENRGDSTYNKVTVDGTETVSEDVYGGMTTVADGKASHNEVTINKGVTLNGHGYVYGGSTDDGSSADNNKVYLNGIRIPGTVYGGTAANGTANGNEVHLNGATVEMSVYGGNGVSTSENKVYLLNGARVTGTVFGGNATSANDNEVHLNGATVTGSVYGGAANGTGNLLSVKGVNSAGWIAGFQKVTFDATGVAAGQHMLTITDTANRTAVDWNALTATGTARGIDLIYHEQGIDLSHYTAGSVKSALSADGKSEYDIEAVDEGGTVKRIAYNSYRFKDARTAETVGGETWGGRSRVGNTTTGNEITVSSGTHTNVYGGWTRGASSQTATADKGNSTHNKVTVKGSAAVSDTVYGGFTDVANGKATRNAVTVEKAIAGAVIGGQSAGDATGNTVTVNANAGAITGGKSASGEASGNSVTVGNGTVSGNVVGGDGTTTNKNIVSLAQANVTGSITGGSGATANENTVNIDRTNVTGTITGGAAGGTGNTLNVAGTNTAANIVGFQKVAFNMNGVAAHDTMLNLTGGAQTKVNWTTLTVTGTAEKPLTLLKNESGIDLAGYTGAAKSETTDRAETNVDVRKNSLGKITAITYEGYQFAGVTTPVIIGTDAYGGISRAGNSTHNNVITVNSNYTNVYGGHTSGAGTTRDDKDNSYSNTVTITGGTLGNVYGGYTVAADGTTNNNTVTLAGGTVTGTVSGGNRTADGNTLNVNTAASVGRVENFEKVTFKDAASKLTLADTGTFNLNTLEVGFDATVNEATLVESGNALTLAGGKTFKSELNADGTQETNLDVRDGNRRIVRYAYTFKGATAATTVGSDTWGGRSAAGNTTTGNVITVGSGTHTNVYGGWTTGAGSTATDKGDSISNNVTVNGAATVSGTVYGGFTDVANGKATGNTVTVEKAIAGSVVGGKALGEASGNIVTVKANTGAVTGGDGATTNNNIVNLEGASVNGTITGGTQADGAGNTLNVAGTNTAANIVGFQKVAFNTNGVAAHGTVLNLTGGAQTNVDWTTLTVTGTAEKPLTLLKNESGIDLEGYTGAAKSETTDTTETNVDVRKNSLGKITAITYEGYQFAGVTTPVIIGTDVYGGISRAGNATHANAITVNGDYTNVYGGHTSGTSTTDVEKKNSHDNTVTITGGTVTGKLYGGYTDAADGKTYNNTVNLNGGNLSNAEISGGNRTIGTEKGNTLNVNTAARVGRIENFEKVTFKDAASKLTLADTGTFNLNTLEVGFDATVNEATLVESGNALTLAGGKTFKSELNADGTQETNLDVRDGNRRIVRYAYTFKGATAATTVGTDTWGGRSVAGNTTAENSVTITGGSYTNVYGGWTTGTGSQAAADKRGDSISNNVTVNGSAAVSGTVYGGYSDVTGGKATRNTVTVDKAIAGSVVGGQSAGDATGNIVNIKADSGAITGGKSASGEATGNSVTVGNGTVSGNIVGGDGTTTNNNIVSLTQANVTGSVTGGSGATANENTVNIDRTNVTGTITGGAAGGTGNTLNVAGTNTAANIVGFQKVAFNTNGVAAHGTVLNLTGGAQTNVDWTTLTVTGTAEKPLTLLKNESGIDLEGYTGAAKSETTDTTETNVDVRKNNDGKVTEITYEGYRFAGVTTPVVSGTDIYGGISRAGNSTHDNAITVNGDYANVYGGHTSGTSTTAVEKKNSHDNTVTITGGTLGNVYGGYTAAADGTTNNNTVTLAGGTVTGTVSGGNRTAQGNKLVVNANARVGRIENFEKYVFNYKESMAADPMLTLTGGAASMRLDAIEANGTVTETPTTLVHNAAGLTIADYDNKPKSMLNADGTREVNLDVRKTGTLLTDIIRYSSYSFKSTTESTTSGGNTWGGRSSAGNTTAENSVTITGGNHTDIYGGWTTGTGSQAAADKRGDSISNKVTVNGSAAVSGTVYGGFTDVANGKATRNEVTVDKAIAGAVVGGKARGEASGNTVTIKANTGAVTGGEGAITNNNTVNLEGASVNGTITGGTQADGAGNTLNVAGTNTAANIVGFQKVAFNTNGVAAHGTVLNLTGGAQTNVDWTTLTVTGTAEKPLTLLKNESGIDLAGYTGAAKSETTDTAETNVDVRKNNDGKVTEITYEGYQFARAESASVIGTDAFGGISKAGNATHANAITVNGDYTNVYGGHTSGTSTTDVEKKNSYDNTVTITGGTLGNVYGGYTAAADGTTNNNTVTLAGGTVTGTVSGGNRTADGNTLNVNTAASVGRVENFEKVTFKDAASKLTLTDTGTFNLDTLATNFDATANPVTLVESWNALTLAGGKAFKSELNADGTQETDLDVRSGKKIVRYAYTFAGAKAATTVGADTWGGRSAAGNTTTGNEITLAGGSYTNVYGGRTTGRGSQAAADKRGDSISNKVTVNGTAAVSGIVYGGYTDVTGGRATDNVVTLEKASVGSVVGGYGTTASSNVINLTDATVSGSVTGGRGTITNDNVIRLRNTKVTGTVTGGSGTITNENRTGFRSVTVSSTAASGTGNTLAVYYGTATTSIGDLGGIQNIHFDLEDAPTDGTAHTLLSLTNAAGEKNLSNINLAVHRSGATKKLRKGDMFTLVENTTAGGSVSIGDNVTAEGTDGVTRNYTFGIARNADGKLVATVTKAGMNEQAKSLVETRTGASAFLNDGADFLAGTGTDAAQKEAAAAAATPGAAPFGLWAGMGGGSLRHETGSYVDMKGWNLGVGWARENAVKAGTLTFGPFVEYGRGSYDSYLDDGTHGSGKTSYVGAGMMAKLETKANSRIDGALRVGRTKSDYTGLDTGYDTTSTYYAMHVGVGKDFRVREGDTVSAYVRYSYAHTAGTTAHLSTGETYDFDAVNSHRLRIGTRYTHGETALSQFYAGLAWEYEFGGDARATCDGDSTPSPSLRGGSGLLELGYRFAPKADSRVSYDLNLNGWQGKRQGVTGGVSVKWAF